MTDDIVERARLAATGHVWVEWRNHARMIHDLANEIERLRVYEGGKPAYKHENALLRTEIGHQRHEIDRLQALVNSQDRLIGGDTTEIGRLRAERDDWKGSAEDAHKICAGKDAEIVLLEASIRRLRADMDSRMKAYVESQEKDEAEIERLRAALEVWLAIPQACDCAPARCACAPGTGCAQAQAREVARRTLEQARKG